MSSPPNPDQSPQSPTPGEETEAGPSFQMSFFVPFPGGVPGPSSGPQAEAGDQGTGNEGTGARDREEGNNRRGMMWSFQFQPNRASTPPVAATQPSGPRTDTLAGGGVGNQRIPTSLPFSGPLLPPLPGPFPHLDLGSMFPPPPIPTDSAPNADQAEGSGSQDAAPDPPTGFPQMIFFVRPDGSVGLNTPLPASTNIGSPSPSNPTTSNDQDTNPRHNPHPFPFPFPFMFPFPFPSDPAPDPEKAKELLGSLPNVEEKVMRRVDRVYAAENTEDGGWKCGVCLEGWEDGDGEDHAEGTEGRDGTGVKRLQCNHLFHADCLEPWFQTKHTCPSCRLDLDPGRTLRSPPLLGLPLRPPPTGSGNVGTRDSHPYRRFHIHRPTAPGPESATSSSTSPANDGSDVEIAAPGIPNRTGTSAFTIHIGPPSSAVNLARSASEPGSSDRSTQAEGSGSSGAATGATPPVMPVPLRRIGIMPRLGRTSPSSSASPTDTGAATVSPRFEPVSPQPNTQLPRPHHHHHHHHHHVHHNHPPHFHIHRAAPSSASPNPNPPNAQTPPAQGEAPFHFIFPAPPSRPSEPSKPVVHVPLETWLRNKEKGLGWRCDSEDCGIAPTGEKRDVFDRMRVDERPKVSDMLVVSPSPTDPADPPGEDGSDKECEHKYHPACFPEAVKLLPPNDGCMDLDDSVRAECGICGIEGSVKWRDVEREEDMVERACGI